MPEARTSLTHPLKIAELAPAGLSGRIGITFCPGKIDSHAMSGAWARDLEIDVEAIRDWGARHVLTLIEAHEFELLGVPALGDAVRAAGMNWLHAPIVDVSVPGTGFEALWTTIGPDLRASLAGGEKLLVHCRGGLGRAGMIAARLLVELGEDPEQAIRNVRAVRPGAIETRVQENHVRRCWVQSSGS